MIKKVVYLKNLPSNIIEEAIFTLKENIEFDINEENNISKKECILEEAQNIIDRYIDEGNYLYPKKKNIFEKILSILNKKM